MLHSIGNTLFLLLVRPDQVLVLHYIHASHASHTLQLSLIQTRKRASSPWTLWSWSGRTWSSSWRGLSSLHWQYWHLFISMIFIMIIINPALHHRKNEECLNITNITFIKSWVSVSSSLCSWSWPPPSSSSSSWSSAWEWGMPQYHQHHFHLNHECRCLTPYPHDHK